MSIGRVSRKELSVAIAQMIPRIIQGVQLDFLAKRTITQTQFFVLVAIHSHRRPSMRLLAQNIKVSMPTISGIVDRLVRAQYVQRLNHPQDRRLVVVELTRKGQLIIDQFQGAVARRWEEVLNSLEQNDLGSLQKIILKLKAALTAGGEP